jgi:hypothetical protein
MFHLIKKLTELPGPVGQEHAVLEYVGPLWREAGAETARTRIGNLVARTEGPWPRLLLVAHADELLPRPIDRPSWLPVAGPWAGMGAQNQLPHVGRGQDRATA